MPEIEVIFIDQPVRTKYSYEVATYWRLITACDL